MTKLHPIPAEEIINRNPTLILFHEFWEDQGFKLQSPVVPIITASGAASLKLVWRNRTENASTTITQFIKLPRG